MFPAFVTPNTSISVLSANLNLFILFSFSDTQQSAANLIILTFPWNCFYVTYLFLLNSDLDGCSFDVKEDGAYIIYTPPGGADPVSKKLGESDIIFAAFAATTISADYNITDYFSKTNRNQNYPGNYIIYTAKKAIDYPILFVSHLKYNGVSKSAGTIINGMNIGDTFRIDWDYNNWIAIGFVAYGIL